MTDTKRILRRIQIDFLNKNSQRKLEGASVVWADEKNSNPKFNDDNAELRYSWKGLIAGKSHFISVGEHNVIINGNQIPYDSVLKFPDEPTLSEQPLGIGPTLYIGDRKNSTYICLEGSPFFGKQGARHNVIYLFDLKNIKTKNTKKPSLIALPSLFNSCEGIRYIDEKKIAFDKISYRHIAGTDDPIGISFDEFYLVRDSFKNSGKQAIGKFVEPNNVFKFSIISSKSK